MLLDMQVPEGSKVIHFAHGKGTLRFNDFDDSSKPRIVCVEFDDPASGFQWFSPTEQYSAIN